MKYYRNLYVSKELQAKVTEVIARLEKGEIQLNKYVIVIAKNEQNHLEFFDSILLQQKVVSKEDLFVVGIAEGYRGALKLVRDITDEIYKKTNDTNIRKYIMENQNEGQHG